jgi:hypothetical protein
VIYVQPTFAAEDCLWKEILYEARIVLTPGMYSFSIFIFTCNMWSFLLKHVLIPWSRLGKSKLKCFRCFAGQACHYVEPGFFRVCYASMAPSSLEIACGRLTRFAEKKRRKRKSRGGEVEIDVIVRNSH